MIWAETEDSSSDKTYRAVAKLEGDIIGSWKWDAYYEFGRNTFDQNYTGDVVLSRLTNAINAVTVNGQIICAANATAVTAPGCVPFNVFGRGNYSAAAAAYVAPAGYQSDDTDENVVSGNLHGDLFSLPGGPLAIATGLEYRSDKMDGSADPLSTSNSFWSFNGKAINGEIRVKEAYAETTAPLIKNLAGVQLLELNGAVRRTGYDRSSPGVESSSVDVTTWKAGIVYKPIDEVLPARHPVTRYPRPQPHRTVRSRRLESHHHPRSGQRRRPDPGERHQRRQRPLEARGGGHDDGGCGLESGLVFHPLTAHFGWTTSISRSLPPSRRSEPRTLSTNARPATPTTARTSPAPRTGHCYK